ncbi:MAG: DUF3179 domain-containing (seleno)protein [Salinibacter sp.]
MALFSFRSLFESRLLLFGVLLALMGSCDARGGRNDRGSNANCVVDTEGLTKGAERGAIEALTNPPILDADEVGKLQDSDRVIGLLAGETPLAVPIRLLQAHEIVNLDHWLDDPIAITHCPLTTSSLAFDRGAISGAEFEVSGLLLHNNLVMVNAQTNESLWPQMLRSPICGSASGALEMVPILDLRWGHWRKLHPNTKVLPVSMNSESSSASRRTVSRSVGHNASTGSGEQSPSGLVLGIPNASLGGVQKASEGTAIAIPFRTLDDGREARVVEVSGDEGPVVFWHRGARAAMAFDTSTSFSVNENGRFVDDATGSVWTLDGRAVEGPRRGERLSPVATAYVAAWSAWSDFHPDTEVWKGES